MALMSSRFIRGPRRSFSRAAAQLVDAIGILLAGRANALRRRHRCTRRRPGDETISARGHHPALRRGAHIETAGPLERH